MARTLTAWCGPIAVVAVLCGPGPILHSAQADALGPPDRMDIGGHVVVLNGNGVRSVGPLDLYGCSLYLSRRTSEPSDIFDAAMATAIRFEILSAPIATGLPTTLRESLRRALSPPQFDRLEGIYRKLKVGDVLLFTYAPGTGTAVVLNGSALLSAEGYGLTRAILEEWLGPETNTRELRSQLLNRPSLGVASDAHEARLRP